MTETLNLGLQKPLKEPLQGLEVGGTRFERHTAYKKDVVRRPFCMLCGYLVTRLDVLLRGFEQEPGVPCTNKVSIGWATHEAEKLSVFMSVITK